MTEPKPGTSIFETTAELIEQSAAPKGAGMTMVRNISELLRSFGSGDSSRINKSLETFGGSAQPALFDQLGQMTRNLHQALQDFNSSLTRDPHNMQSTNIGDATIKLENVVKMTSEAAHKTLGLSESQSKLIEECRNYNAQLQAAITEGKPNSEIQALLDKQKTALELSEHNNNEILMAQSFQDLTGQAVRKVITLVSELEHNLVSMIKIFGVQERPHSSNENIKEKLAQDDVDSILSDFGF